MQLRLDVAASKDEVIEWRYSKANSYEIDPMGGSQRNLITGKVRHVRRRGPPSGAPANVDMPAVPTRNSQGAVLEEERDPSIQVGETKARVMVERERQAQECEGVSRALESELGSKSMIPAPLEGGEILFGGSSWNEVFANEASRINKGIRDYDALATIGYPTKDEIECYANPTLRFTDEPEWEIDMEGTAQMFANYLVQFKVIAGNLDAKREVWNEFIEPVDPMRFDEGALRIVERLIIMDLEGKGAQPNQL